jgi:hypothetical protein
MNTETIPNMSALILDFFGKTAKQLSKACGFTRRKSKLSGEQFASALVLSFINNPKSSLEDICQFLNHKKIKITRQGIHDRFNATSVFFMQQLFKECSVKFKNKSENLIELLKPFQSVNLLDSSGFKLPEALKNEFKGHGGSSPNAGLKLQVMLDYLNGIDDLWITEATKNDQGFRDHLSFIKKGGLYLQDLGYFVLDSFKKIQSEEAYFISRFLKKTLVFQEDGKELDLLLSLKRAGLKFEQNVYIGKKDRLLVRMVAERVPEAVAEKRVREEIAYGKRKGYTPSDRSLELMNWSIFVTNIPPTLLTLEQIILVYKLRWQIEIFFKLCKSEFAINHVSGKHRERILCELFAKLIGVVLLLYIATPVRWGTYQELSFRKAFKKLSNLSIDWYRALKSSYLMEKFLKKILDDFKHFAFKRGKKIKKKTTVQKLMDATGQEKLSDYDFSLA